MDAFNDNQSSDDAYEEQLKYDAENSEEVGDEEIRDVICIALLNSEAEAFKLIKSQFIIRQIK